MMPTLRLLQTFVAVAEELHFGRAAQRLHMSQPPLSQHVRQLEEELGVTLFSRTTRQVRLTAAGTVLLKRARQLLADGQLLADDVRRVSRGETGTLTIGFSNSATYRILARGINLFRERYPDVTLEFREMHAQALIAGLRTERIDAALLRPSLESLADPTFEFSVVSSEPMQLVLPLDHPLARADVVPVSALDGLPYIDYGPEDGRYFRELAQTIFAAGKVAPRCVQVSVLPTILVLVEAGLGFALAPRSASRLLPGHVVFKDLAGVGNAVTAVMHGGRRRNDDSPAAAAFIEIARRVGQTPA